MKTKRYCAFTLISADFPERAMVLVGKSATEFETEVRARCAKLHDLLLASARPILQHGTDAEAPCLEIWV